MNEFLTGLSSGTPLLWAVFVLGVMATAALALTAFWDAVLRSAGWMQRWLRRAEQDDVLPKR